MLATNRGIEQTEAGLCSQFIGAINPSHYHDAMVWLPYDWQTVLDRCPDRLQARRDIFRYLSIASRSARGDRHLSITVTTVNSQ